MRHAGACRTVRRVGSGCSACLDTVGGICLFVGASVLGVPAVRRRQAPAAVARAAQAHALLHLHRLRAGAADHRLLPARAGCCCSSTSARTWCGRRVAALVDQAQFLAQTAALELRARSTAASMDDAASGGRRAPRPRYPLVSLRRSSRCDRTCGDPDDRRASAMPRASPWRGPWAHLDAARRRSRRGCRAAVTRAWSRITDGDGPTRLAARGVAWPGRRARRGRAVVVDVPLDGDAARTSLQRARRASARRSRALIDAARRASASGGRTPDRQTDGSRRIARGPPPAASLGVQRLNVPMGRRFSTTRDWDTGQSRHRLTVQRPDEHCRRLRPHLRRRRFSRSAASTSARSCSSCWRSSAGCSWSSRSWRSRMGLALARSITGSVHELFAGTERVRQRRLHAQDSRSARAISSASWPSRSTR